MIDPRLYLSLAAFLFCCGIFGLLSRKNAIGTLLSIELMANAVNLNLSTFAHTLPGGAAAGQAFALFSMALTVAEVVVGLAIVVLIYRTRGDILLELASDLKE